MSYSATTRWGDTIDKPSERQMDELLSSLSLGDDDEAEVSLAHESGWTLTVFDDGRIVFSNLEDGDPPRHMSHQSRGQILSLWHNLARGETESLQSHAWQDGSYSED